MLRERNTNERKSFFVVARSKDETEREEHTDKTHRQHVLLY